MQTPIRELQGQAVAGALAVLAGVALWQLGVEFERAWMRSYDEPLLGDTFDGDRGGVPQRAQTSQAIPATGERHRQVAKHHPRAVRRATHVA